MSNMYLKRIMAYIVFSFIIGGCAPLVPGNYLGPTTIQTPQKINGKWVTPRLIPVNTAMLSSPEGRTLLEPAMQPKPYQIGSFDELNIIVWGHPDLSSVATIPSPTSNFLTNGGGSGGSNIISGGGSNPSVLVQTDGTIFYPYVGHLKVSGLTVNEAQAAIAGRFIKYIRNPQVTVQVAKFRNRNAYVLGEVIRPGMQPLTDKPLTLMEAISSAGGINTTSADPKHIYLVRGSYIQPDVFWLDAETPQSLLIAERFPLQENDIVYVSAATLTGVNQFLNQIMPSLTNYAIAKEFSR